LRHKKSNKIAVALKKEEAYISSDFTLEFMVVEVFVLLGLDAAEVRVWLPMLRDSLWALSPRVLDTLILEEGSDRLSRKVGNQTPTYAAQRPRIVKVPKTYCIHQFWEDIGKHRYSDHNLNKLGNSRIV
jgi:hypothetical protein